MPVSSDEETLEKVNTVTKNGPRTNQLITNESNPEDFILSQPRELYASHKRPGPEQLPRWPAECEVVFIFMQESKSSLSLLISSRSLNNWIV